MSFVVSGFESQPVDSDVQILDAYRRIYIFSRYKEISAILNRSERNLQRSNQLFEFGKREESTITMATREVEAAEFRFRIYDGTDIAHDTYLLTTTIESLKERIVAEWPQGREIAPNSVHDIGLILAGKVLDKRTLAESKITFGHSPGEVITVHAVVQPETEKKKKKRMTAAQDNKGCSCAII